MNDWTEQAACKGMDTAIFFPKRGRDFHEAKAACARCEVRQPCLDEAMRAELGRRGHVFGYRAGLTPDGRIEYRRSLRKQAS